MTRDAFRDKGQSVGVPGVTSAVTAIHRDLTLVARNRPDFERIDGLKFYSPPSSARSPIRIVWVSAPDILLGHERGFCFSRGVS